MTATNIPITQTDEETSRTRSLVKVYSLLIRLAEHAGNQSIDPDVVSMDERANKPTPIQSEPSNKEV